MVELATERVPNARFELADMRSLQCEAGTWDAVLVFFSMLQLDRAEQDATITKLAQWLTPGGYLVLATVPGDADGVTIEWMGHLARVSTYPTAVLRHRLEAAGLRIVREDRTQFTPSDPLLSGAPATSGGRPSGPSTPTPRSSSRR
jgi:trans-aconitate methyltransferase